MDTTPGTSIYDCWLAEKLRADRAEKDRDKWQRRYYKLERRNVREFRKIERSICR
jgi:hypothetical protein